MIDKKTKGKIIASLRRLTYTHPARNEAKRLQKIDKALFKCECCQSYCYDGKSVKTFNEYVIKYPGNSVQMIKVQVDHKNSVIPIESGWKWDWNEFVDNLFCDIDNLQLLCENCHDIKTKKEQEQRTELRRLNKQTLDI